MLFKQNNRRTAIERECENCRQDFEACSLAQINSAGLMRRMDAKFVFPTSILPSILPNLQANYLIKPENYDALLADLRERTGLAISRCEVSRFHSETG